MVKQIKDTPVLTGRDAIKFFNNLENNKCKKVSRDVVLSIRESAKKLESILVKE
jgi:hypothetical protein